MLQLLVDGRDDLQVNDLVPVGDLFDVLVDSDAQAVTDELKKQFETARRLYHAKLRRVLLDLHGLTEEQATDAPRTDPFRTDDRLVKTLLLSALAPDVPALSGLTASRLSALNHGTIQAWIPGQEVAVVLQKMKNVAAQVGEVQIGEGDDPVISVELTEVDYEGVIERARGVDNEGNRRRALRELVWEQLGVREESTLDGVQAESLVWRGRKVVVDLVFGNVRDHADLPDAALMAEADRWKVVVDYPFDSEGQSPLSDLSRVETLQQQSVRSNTLIWIPGFLTRQRLEDLGTYVVLEHLLGGTGDRFHQYAQHLSPVDREQARALLRQRRDLMREKLVGCLKQAYGAAARLDADIDTGNALESPFATLAEGFTPQPPVGATLRDAFVHLVSQALGFAWPAHPRFEPGDQEVRAADIRRVLEHCEQAVEAPGGRHQVDPRDRGIMRRICNTLEVGRFHENHLQLDQSTFPWSRRLLQAAARDSLTGIYPVSDMLGYLDEPEPRGLDRATSGLILRVFALMEDLAWYRDGVAVEPPAAEQVGAAYQLRQPTLPDEQTWLNAVECGRSTLGLNVTELLSAANLARLGAGAREAAQKQAGACRDLERLLGQHRQDLDVESGADRWDALMVESDDSKVVSLLASAQWPTSPAAGRRSLESAGQVSQALHRANWEVLRALTSVTDKRKDEAVALRGRLRDVATRDELAASLSSELPAVERAAIRLLTVTPPPPPPPPPAEEHGEVTVSTELVDEVLNEIREAAERHKGATMTVTWQVNR
jgi:hypothetical protein